VNNNLQNITLPAQTPVAYCPRVFPSLQHCPACRVAAFHQSNENLIVAGGVYVA
jgi:hypothetical protein